MNKFITAIAGTAEGIKLKRAQDTANSVKLAQESLINDKRKSLNSLNARLTRLLDIGPDTLDSLRPVGKDFNPESWVAEVQDVKFSIARAEETLAIAEQTYSEWFTEMPAPAAPVA